MGIVTLDRMTGPNWDDLEDHIGETGAQWTPHPSTPNSRWYLFNGKVHCGVAGLLYASGVPDSADYTVSCDYTIFSDIPNVGIAGRVNPASANYYYCYYQSGELVLAKVVSGVITSLGVDIGLLAGGGTTHQLALDMVGTTIRVLVGGVERISVVDGGITAAGRGGVRSAGINDAGTGKHIDTFTVTDTSTPAPGASSRGYSYVIGA